MSRIDVLVDRDGTLTRAAVLTDGRLTDLHIDRADKPSLLGHVFLGRVERIVSGIDAAFVELGGGVSGFLVAADVRHPSDADNPDGRPRQKTGRIGALLRTGQPVLVQVKADATASKGPSLTMDVTLPGRFLIHAPFGRSVAVSKRLGAGPERAGLGLRVQRLATGSGWIVRAGAAVAGDDRLAAESETLHLLWRGIRDAAESATAPSPLHAGPSAPVRALIEQGAAPASILVDDESMARRLAGWCADHAPDLLPLIERHKAPPRLFDLRDLDSAIADLLDTRVELPRGGSLVIEPTEALTVVDVNAGERGNPLDVNLDAAAEIARQLRLRNVGGIVVVDFVNMRSRGDAERVLAALHEAVDGDPVQTQVYGMSKLGLVELTRARRGSPLAALLTP
ncbi:ribonuclease E/ribonuclease G [Azospirillum agricola]|uniref:ribonuclease E/G n=1 Tax=Azospirillum agricola TaxID=1720247 RepID=UPI001AE62880|nr:ribonuclease E/G [Azospirillum agricola]MBP2228557.1 ribonuclease E/ribonuclease G [Azospirillum agricola]